jgi:hypothetical protein
MRYVGVTAMLDSKFFRPQVHPTSGPEQRWQSAVGAPFLFTAANWSGVSWYLEAYLRANGGKVLARLYDVTADAPVANSTITADATVVNTRVRSSALALTDGHEYRVQFGLQDGGGGAFTGAKLVSF